MSIRKPDAAESGEDAADGSIWASFTDLADSLIGAPHRLRRSGADRGEARFAEQRERQEDAAGDASGKPPFSI